MNQSVVQTTFAECVAENNVIFVVVYKGVGIRLWKDAKHLKV